MKRSALRAGPTPGPTHRLHPAPGQRERPALDPGLLPPGTRTTSPPLRSGTSQARFVLAPSGLRPSPWRPGDRAPGHASAALRHVVYRYHVRRNPLNNRAIVFHSERHSSLFQSRLTNRPLKGDLQLCPFPPTSLKELASSLHSNPTVIASIYILTVRQHIWTSHPFRCACSNEIDSGSMRPILSRQTAPLNQVLRCFYQYFLPLRNSHLPPFNQQIPRFSSVR